MRENPSHGAAHVASSQNQMLVEPQRGLAIPERLTRAESRQRLYVRPSQPYRVVSSILLQRIFCERLPGAPPPYGRKTTRFNKSLTAIGFALGGRAGERLASDLYLSSSARTLLRRIYDEPVGKA